MGDLLDWALSLARGKKSWRNSKPQSWSQDTERFFAALTAFDRYLASDAALHARVEKLFQGAVADALTHVGQIAMLRRLAGARVRGENYYLAKIEAGRTGPVQLAPVSEFDSGIIMSKPGWDRSSSFLVSHALVGSVML